MTKREPVAIAGVMQAVIAIAASIGLELTAVELGHLYAALAAITTFIVRRYVSPS